MATEKKYVSLAKLGLYDEKIKGVISAGDAQALVDAKAYADGLAVNYDAAGAAATAEANAKAYADGKDAAIQAAQKAADDAAAAAGVADGKAVAAQGEVDALEAYVGEFTHDTAKTVVEYINAKTDGIATSGNLEALGARVTAVEGDVATIKGDYLKAADKTEIEGKITAVQGAVDTEKSRAEGIEAGLASRIKAVEDDYLKGADKEELQGNIDTLTGVVETLRDGVDAEKVDGVKDLIDYVEEHGTEVTGMKEDIAQNASDISGVAGRMTTAEGEIDALQGAVATKAEQTALDEAVEALEGADAGQVQRIAALEAKFGGADGSVEDMIADAKQEAISAAASAADTKDAEILRQAKAHAESEDDKIEATIATLQGVVDGKAAASDVTDLQGRMTTVEGKVSTLEGKMTAVEALAAANEQAIAANVAAIALKADQTALDGAVTRIEAVEAWQNTMIEVSEQEINNLFTA